MDVHSIDDLALQLINIEKKLNKALELLEFIKDEFCIEEFNDEEENES